MTSTITKATEDDRRPAAAQRIRMTPAMREGLDSLEREYTAFVESWHKAMALITKERTHHHR